MFKRIIIELTGPLCDCKVHKLAWCPRETDEGYGFKVWCRGCGTTILVPHEKFVAGWRLDAPYPEKDTGEMLKQREKDESKEAPDEALGSEPTAET